MQHKNERTWVDTGEINPLPVKLKESTIVANVAGADADGQAPTENPVKIAGKDAGGLVQTILTKSTGELDLPAVVAELVAIKGKDFASQTTLASVLAELEAKSNPAEWTQTATADNAMASVTRAAEVGKRHYITGISASFSAANVKLLELKDGAAVIGNFHVHNQRDVEFGVPIELTANSAAELSLPASGTAGVIGAVTLRGFTR